MIVEYAESLTKTYDVLSRIKPNTEQKELVENELERITQEMSTISFYLGVVRGMEKIIDEGFDKELEKRIKHYESSGEAREPLS